MPGDEKIVLTLTELLIDSSIMYNLWNGLTIKIILENELVFELWKNDNLKKDQLGFINNGEFVKEEIQKYIVNGIKVKYDLEDVIITISKK